MSARLFPNFVRMIHQPKSRGGCLKQQKHWGDDVGRWVCHPFLQRGASANHRPAAISLPSKNVFNHVAFRCFSGVARLMRRATMNLARGCKRSSLPFKQPPPFLRLKQLKRLGLQICRKKTTLRTICNSLCLATLRLKNGLLVATSARHGLDTLIGRDPGS